MTKGIAYKIHLEDGRRVFIKTNHAVVDPTPINSTIFHEHEPSERLAELLLMSENVLEVRITPESPIEHCLIYAR
jgi:hypothetical protein